MIKTHWFKKYILFDNLKEYIFVFVNFKDESSNYLTKNLKRVNLQKVGPVSVLYKYIENLQPYL